jgi:predicted small integral membrane protein
MAWMAWTWPTAMFFIAIGAALLALTVLEIVRPTASRRGILPLDTTRGDRFFISLLSAAFIHIGWLAVSDLPVLIASAIAVGAVIILMRWG